MRKKIVTLSDIAQKAGVSITTVSHVINKTRFVAQETRDDVLRALDELGYRVQKAAPAKSGETPRTIGVIVADIREDYFIMLAKAIETVAEEYGISMLLCDSEDDPEKERLNALNLLAAGVGGLIVAPIEFGPYPRELKNAEVPVVLVDRQYKNHDACFVGINNFESGRMATTYLFDKGCSKVGFIGHVGAVSTNLDRMQGYKAGLLERNSRWKPEVLSVQYEREDSYTLIKRFLGEHGFDGLVCSTADICNETLAVVRDQDIPVPGKLKIITYDDNKWFDYLRYPVSIVAQPTGEIGNFAVQRIVQDAQAPRNAKRIKTEVLYDVHIIDRLN